jgi:hypothetical protein
VPQIDVVFYREDDGSVPILEWLDTLQPKALDKCRVRIERLKEAGHDLRRPEADFLRDGIYDAPHRAATFELSDFIFFPRKDSRRCIARFNQGGGSADQGNRKSHPKKAEV